MTDRMTRKEVWAYFEHALTAAVVAEKGKIAAIDTATGLLTKGATSATLRPIGYFDQDATGDGTTKVRVRLFADVTLHWFSNDVGTPVVAADLGKVCYILNDTTVTGASAGASVAGRVWAVNASLGVAVEMLGFYSAVS